VWQVEARISHLNNDVSMAVEAKGGTGSAVVSNGSLADPSSTVRYEKYAPPPSGTMKLRLVDGAASKTAFKILSASQQEYLIQVRVQPSPFCLDALCVCATGQPDSDQPMSPLLLLTPAPSHPVSCPWLSQRPTPFILITSAHGSPSHPSPARAFDDVRPLSPVFQVVKESGHSVTILEHVLHHVKLHLAEAIRFFEVRCPRVPLLSISLVPSPLFSLQFIPI